MCNGFIQPELLQLLPGLVRGSVPVFGVSMAVDTL